MTRDPWCRIVLVYLLIPIKFGCSEQDTCSNIDRPECKVYNGTILQKDDVTLDMDVADVASAEYFEDGENFALKWNRIFGLDAPLQRPLEPSPWQKDDEFASVISALDRDGAIVLRGAAEPSLVSAIHRKFYTLLEQDVVLTNITEMELENRTGAFYNSERPVEGIRIRKATQGRYEFKSLDRRDGGDIAHRLQIPESVEPLLLSPLMKRLLSNSMNTPWRLKSAGVIMSFPGAQAGDWHRDICQGLFGEALDISLPDYYFVALWPLDVVTQEQGSELVLRSHKVATADLDPQKDVERVVTIGNPGDVMFFNGKIIHRGMPNPTNETRSLLYVVYAAKWYEQGRDQRSEYWVSSSSSEVRPWTVTTSI